VAHDDFTASIILLVLCDLNPYSFAENEVIVEIRPLVISSCAVSGGALRLP
jgi:hypothetical protein